MIGLFNDNDDTYYFIMLRPQIILVVVFMIQKKKSVSVIRAPNDDETNLVESDERTPILPKDRATSYRDSISL